MKLGKTYFSGSLSFDEGNNTLGPNTAKITGSFTGSFDGVFTGNAVSSISGAFTQDSSSLASRITDLETFEANIDNTYATDSDVTAVSNRVGTLEGKTLVSSSAQIADDISGSFTSVSSSIASDLVSNYLRNTTDTLTGDLTVTGTITAQEFHTEFVSASIIYKSGSTQFGNSYDDTHSFTGSLQSIYSENGITGSFRARGGQVDIQGDDADLNFRLDSGSGANLGEIRFWVNQDQLGEISMHKNTGNMIIENQTQTGYLSLRTGDGAILNITGSSVGIGTASPAYKLEIYDGVDRVLRAGTSFVSIDSAGSVSSPSLIFDGDDNTGFWHPSTDTLAISTAGTERARIDSTGNVGIGTDSPGTRLHVQNTASSVALFERTGGAWAKVQIKAGTDTGNSYLEFFDQTGIAGSLNYEHANDSLIFNVSSSNAMVITHDGNVGIGTTGPGNLLHLLGNSAAVRVEESGGAQVRMVAGGSLGYVGTYSNHDLQLLTNSSPAVTITAGGNMGIGTTLATEKLHLAGNVAQVDGSPEYHFGTTSASHYNWRVAAQEVVDAGFEIASGTQSAGIGAASDTYTTRLVIKGDTGRVGIGTTIPATRLHISHDSSNNQLTLERTGTATGMFQIYTNTNSLFIFDAAQTQHRLYINSNGNVGLGTTSANARLEVKDSGNDIQMRVGSLSAGRSPYIRLQGQPASGAYNVYGDIQLDAENQLLKLNDPGTSSGAIGTNPVVVDASGRLGVSTTSPSTYGEATVFGNLVVGEKTLARALDSNKTGVIIAGTGGLNGVPQDGSERLPILRIHDTVPNYGSATATLGEIRGGIEWYSEETSGDYPKLHTAIYTVNTSTYGVSHALAFYTGDTTERMRIQDNGNIGIGTNAPAYPLDIEGTAGYLVNLNNTGDDARLQFQRAGTANGHISAGNGLMTMYGNSGTSLRFMPGASTAMYMQASDGNVGIGTTSPKAKFHVQGDTSLYANYHGEKVFVFGPGSAFSIDLPTEFGGMSLTTGNTWAVIGDMNCFGAGGTVEVRTFYIGRNSSGTWSPTQYSASGATTGASLQSVTGSSNSVTINMNANSYLTVKLTVMVR